MRLSRMAALEPDVIVARQAASAVRTLQRCRGLRAPRAAGATVDPVRRRTRTPWLGVMDAFGIQPDLVAGPGRHNTTAAWNSWKAHRRARTSTCSSAAGSRNCACCSDDRIVRPCGG